MSAEPYAFSAGYYELLRTAAGPDGWPPVGFFADLVPEGANVLELGPGTGRITLAVAERAASVYCLERSATMRAVLLSKLAQRPDLLDKVTVLDGAAPDFKLNRRFDMVCFGGVLEHIPVDARLRLFTTIREHLVDGGLLAMDMVLDEPVPEWDEHVRGEVRAGDCRYELSTAVRKLGPDLGRLRYVYRTYLGDELIATESVERDHNLHRREPVLKDLEAAGFEAVGGSVLHAPTYRPEEDGNPGTLVARAVAGRP
ncbi:class I SAM-dependent methyltransferase [Actinomadura keratinilytica]|jgi:SAM-dependent methyltransferase|uniref:Methyltransferase domain-containing protein n=1 Tax=Actinomadura keratinilytica TaxID=547461 RepID=A0ABP7YP73_9ACTN